MFESGGGSKVIGDRCKVPTVVKLIMDILGKRCARHDREAVVGDVLSYDGVREEECDGCGAGKGEGSKRVLGILDGGDSVRTDLD